MMPNAKVLVGISFVDSFSDREPCGCGWQHDGCVTFEQMGGLAPSQWIHTRQAATIIYCACTVQPRLQRE
jgi:hypothetical protein